MKRQPSWGFFFLWVGIYTVLDLGIDVAIDGRFSLGQLKGAIGGAVFGAGMTFLFALRKWSKSEGF